MTAGNDAAPTPDYIIKAQRREKHTTHSGHATDSYLQYQQIGLY